MEFKANLLQYINSRVHNPNIINRKQGWQEIQQCIYIAKHRKRLVSHLNLIESISGKKSRSTWFHVECAFSSAIRHDPRNARLTQQQINAACD